MADTKITDLAEVTRVTLVETDETVVVDISDTSMAASGTDVKANLMELVAAGYTGAIGKAIAIQSRMYF
jgi:hypothetical protein